MLVMLGHPASARLNSRSSIPANDAKGLLKAHSSKSGVWEKIVILEGELRDQINEPEIALFTPDTFWHGFVEPEIKHEVAPLDKVRFYVKFIFSWLF